MFALATGNSHKLEEFSRALGEQIVPPSRYGLVMDVEETGTTFEDNALIKARWLAQKSGVPSLADDSGLEVDALDGAPGVYSARFGGAGLDDRGRRLLLLEKLKDVPPAKRTARFVCVLALCEPGGREHTFRGECEGSILFEERGQGGFGYDPVFLFPPAGLSFAEMSARAKDEVSHRGRAIQKLREFLKARD